MLSMSQLQSKVNRFASSELRRMGQASSLLESMPPVRPSIISAVGLAGFALGSHFVPKKNPILKKGLILGAILSGLAAGYYLYAGK